MSLFGPTYRTHNTSAQRTWSHKERSGWGWQIPTLSQPLRGGGGQCAQRGIQLDCQPDIWCEIYNEYISEGMQGMCESMQLQSDNESYVNEVDERE